MTEIPVYPAGLAGAGAEAHVQAGGGSLLDVELRLETGVGRLVSVMDREYRRRVGLTAAVTPFVIDPIPVVLSAGAGTLDVPQLLRPTLGRYWDIQSVAAQGFTAGTVNGYINGSATSGASSGRLIAPFPTAGVLTFGSGPPALLRGGQDRLVFVAAGITGTVLISLEGTAVLDPWIGEYLT